MKITASGGVIKEVKLYTERIFDFKKRVFMHLAPSLFPFVSFEEVEDIERCAIKITATISVLSETERETLLRLVGEMAHSTDISEKVHEHEEIARILRTI